MVMCQWAQNRMPAYLSGELGARQAGWLLWHVRQCHVCRKALQMMKAVQTLVAASLPADVSAPEGFTSRVISAIDALPQGNSPPERRRWPWSRR